KTNQLAEFQKKEAKYTGDLQIAGDDEDGFVLFENRKARPRAYLVHSVIPVATPEESLSRLLDPSVTWNKVAVIEGTIPGSAGFGPASNSNHGSDFTDRSRLEGGAPRDRSITTLPAQAPA